MTQNRDELKEKCAAEIRDEGTCGFVVEDERLFCFDKGVEPEYRMQISECDCWRAAEACLSAIEQSGCTIVPNEPTLTQLKNGAKTIRQQNQYGGGSEFADSRAAYVSMLSSSPFKEKEDG